MVPALLSYMVRTNTVTNEKMYNAKTDTENTSNVKGLNIATSLSLVIDIVGCWVVINQESNTRQLLSKKCARRWCQMSRGNIINRLNVSTKVIVCTKYEHDLSKLWELWNTPNHRYEYKSHIASESRFYVAQIKNSLLHRVVSQL